MHSKRCLAQAIISAVENLRDEEGTTDIDFRLEVQKNTPLEWADGYLKDGTQTCTCGYAEEERLFAIYLDHGAETCEEHALEALQVTKTLSPEGWMRLARRIRLNPQAS